ncbi:ABC transporter substrate-binding protein [Streptococcus sp. sy010]|nr:ABC transporter substrate-binding protein [Streptococcus sp. sy010]
MIKNKRLFSLLGLGFLALIIFGVFSSQKKQESAQEEVKVGVLQYVTHEALDTIYAGIQEGLKQAGYDDKLVTIDFLNAEGDQSKVQTMSQTLVNNGNQVLVGIATPAAQGLANATKTIPVVMGAVTDPVGANLVKDLEKPSGNVTGVSDQTPIASQLELIKTLTPSVKTIGILYSSSEDNSKSQVEEFTKMAKTKGYQVETYAVPSTNEIATTLNVMLDKVDALWVPLDNTIASAFATVVSVTKEAKKPIFPSVDTMVAEGGLASVVIDQYQLGVATGQMVAKVLDGEKIANLPVEIFSEGKPVINKKVAVELGISIPEEVLSSASQIIE